MDLARYLDLYLAESREHLGAAFAIQTQLEAEPTDHAPLGALMRHAHSLKGMAATMGYQPIVELAHAIEDMVCGLQRDGQDRLDACLPLLGDSLACLGELLEDVEQQGTLYSERAARLTATLRGQFGESPGSETPAGSASDTPRHDPSEEEVRTPRPGGHHWAVELLLDDRPARSAGWTTRVLGRLAGLGRVVQIDPPRVALETGRFEGRLGLVLSSTSTREELERQFRQQDGIQGFSIEPVQRTARATLTPATETWIRVRADRLDTVIDELQQLRLDHGRMCAALDDGTTRATALASGAKLKKLHGTLLELRLVPFDSMAHRLQQAVRELAPRLGKRLRFEIRGGDVRMDRSVLDTLVDPLLHVLRNAVDHGIETPEERLALGKDAAGSLSLSLTRQGERVDLCVRDDGRGIQLDRVRRVAEEQGLLEPEHAEDLGDRELTQFLTRPGFSTAEQVSHVSGRGVGLDVVQSTVERIGGRIAVDSVPGEGTEIRLVVPARLSLIQILLVRSAGTVYGMPVDRVVRALPLSEARKLDDSPELVRLDERLAAVEDRDVKSALIVLVDGVERERGLLVDELIGRREVVVRPLPPPLNLMRRYSGAALLDDGSVALVLDPVAV